MKKYDLFRVLRKSSYDEVSIAILGSSNLSKKDCTAIYKEHGWTRREYRVEGNRRLKVAIDNVSNLIRDEIDKDLTNAILNIAKTKAAINR
tara:strand:- start:325 stop:597 length:273 start_codon:yes stop_codon:yes gene_type:complete